MSRRRTLLLLVGLAAFLGHLRAGEGRFLWYDDSRFVVANQQIDHLGNPLRFFTDLSTTASAEHPTDNIYRPLRTLTFALIHAAFGKRPKPFHIVSILLHAACAMLLMLLLLQAGVVEWAAAAGAGLFALHPATVETTAWICSLGDLLCGVFVLLAMLLYARDHGWAALAALALALFSKEHAVVVPGLWLAWDFFFRRDRLRRGLRSAALWRGAVAGLLLVVAFLFWRAHVGAAMRQVPEPLGGSHLAAVRTMLAGLGWYAATILFPFGPTFDARVPVQESFLAAPVLAGLLVLVLLCAGLRFGTRRSRLGCAWFLMALVPVSNVIVPLKVPTADRFLYLPLMGISFAAVEGVVRLPVRVARTAVPALLVLLGALTIVRIGDWRDDASLIAAGKRVRPRSTMLLWAEASLANSRALDALEAGDAAMGVAYGTQAEGLYLKYLKNAPLDERTQALVELGDLDFELGRWSLAHEAASGRYRKAYRAAMNNYNQAWENMRHGLGRVIDRELRHVGERLVRLSIALATPANPNVGKTIKVGLEALHLLETRYGVDPTLDRARLRLCDSIVVRTSHPAAARKGFDAVLAMLA